MTTYNPTVHRSIVLNAIGEFSFQRLTTALRGLVTQYDNRPDGSPRLFFVSNGDEQEKWAESVANWVDTQAGFLDMLGIRTINIFKHATDTAGAKAVMETAIAEDRIIIVATGPDYSDYIPTGFKLDDYACVMVQPETNFKAVFLQPAA